jgi:two-component system, OmpR family, sensor kinase
MKRGGSLRRRLSIGLAVAITVTWLLAALAGGVIARHELYEAFDSALQETAQRLLPLAALEIFERSGVPSVRHLATVGKHEEYLTYIVRDQAGNLLLRSHDADPSAFPPAPVKGFRTTSTHRVYGEGSVGDTLLIEIAEPLDHRRKAAFQAMAGLFAPLPLLIPLSVLGVLWFVRRSLRPVVAFAAEIEARGESNLSPVTSEELPDEIGSISDAVTRLMERLRRVLDAERSFTANSAHELRTPIAASLAQTQRLIAETAEGPLHERALQLEASLRHLARISEKLMQLAKAEGGRLLAEAPQDLAPALELVVDEFRRRADGAPPPKLNLHISGELHSLMDADAFAILMRNLIENAIRHGTPDGQIDVMTMEGGVVRVLNAGAVVAPEVLSRLKMRFERGATSAKGAGLGLAIADAIATGAGGRLDLMSPASGHRDGFEADLYLPQSMPMTQKRKAER